MIQRLGCNFLRISSKISCWELQAERFLTHVLLVDQETSQNGFPVAIQTDFSGEPADAYRAAVEQDKLVFLIHISGNFKIPGFT